VVQFQPEALVLAASYGSWHDVALLVHNFGSYTIDSCMHPLGLTALHVAVLRGSVRMVRVLLEAGECVSGFVVAASLVLVMVCVVFVLFAQALALT
jgi:ankyrin repeat protein